MSKLDYLGDSTTELGTCPVCERSDVTVTRKGKMRHHKGDLWVGGWRQMCTGTGQPPKAES